MGTTRNYSLRKKISSSRRLKEESPCVSIRIYINPTKCKPVVEYE